MNTVRGIDRISNASGNGEVVLIFGGGTTHGANALITFTVTVPKNFTEKEIKGFLAQQGYARGYINARARNST